MQTYMSYHTYLEVVKFGCYKILQKVSTEINEKLFSLARFSFFNVERLKETLILMCQTDCLMLKKVSVGEFAFNASKCGEMLPYQQ